MWVRGLKLAAVREVVPAHIVAPHVGAWIEIAVLYLPAQQGRLSHPMWVRGLKYGDMSGLYLKFAVAPHVGAWIEIQTHAWTAPCCGLVAPHVGAWIEIPKALCRTPCGCVAPHVGAWIEIIPMPINLRPVCSRTPCGCVD